jgi:hypothetical protein
MHCKFTIVRPDRVEHNDNVNDRIISEIRSCQFMVADFTLHRNGVYFEAGLASGLGRPVICTCRRDEMRDAHFDTRPPFPVSSWSVLCCGRWRVSIDQNGVQSRTQDRRHCP